MCSRPLLDFCVIPSDLDGSTSTKMVELLFKYGANVNQRWEGFTTWQVVLYRVHCDCNRRNLTDRAPYFRVAGWAHILKLLLQHGADPFASCANISPLDRSKHESHRIEDIITDVFEDRLPHEANELRFVLQAQKTAHNEPRTSQPLLRYKDDRNNRKRHFSGYEELEPRNRRPHPDPLYFNRPPSPSPRDRYMYSTSRRSLYDSQSTWHFPR